MKFFKRITLYVLIFVGIITVLNLPVNTRQGINGVVSVKTIPLYVKMSGFLYRDYQYKALSREITRGITTDRGKITAIYNWAVKNIRAESKDFPVVDDHPWNIAIRRYGTAGQMADIFTTLVSYAGYDFFYEKLEIDPSSAYIILSFVKIGDTWYTFDVYNKMPFIGGKGRLTLTPYGPSYDEYLNTANKEMFESHTRRPDKQKIMPRLIYEFKKIFDR